MLGKRPGFELRYVVERRKRFLRRSLLFAVVLGIAVAMFVAFGPASRPPLAFISEVQGEWIPERSRPAFHRRNDARRVDYYGFRVNSDTVLKAMKAEMEDLGWVPLFARHVESYSDYKVNGVHQRLAQEEMQYVNFWSSVPDDLKAEGYTCFVVVRHRPTWLECQWAAIWRWLGAR